MALTAGFPFPTEAHSSRVVMRQSSRIGTSTASLVSVVAAVAGRPLRGLSPLSFLPFLKWRAQRLTELTSMASSPYTLLSSLWTYNGLEPSAIRNLITTLGLIRKSTSSILYRYCVKRMWLTGVPMILVQLDSVANRWVRKETLLGETLKAS